MINLQNACDLLIYYDSSSSAHDESLALHSRKKLLVFSTLCVCVFVCLYLTVWLCVCVCVCVCAVCVVYLCVCVAT